MTQTVADPAAEVERLNALVSHTNAVNSILFEQLTYKDQLLQEANNHRGILQTALAQRDAEITSLKERLAVYEPPAPLPPPIEPPQPPTPEPPTPDPQQPEPPSPLPPPIPEPIPDPVEPFPDPTPPPEVVQDLTLYPKEHSLGVTLLGAFPPSRVVDTLVYRKRDGTQLDTTGQNWTKGLPCWSLGGVLKGSVFPLEADTAYDVRLTVDGVTHGGSGRTLADGRVSHAALVGAA